MQSRLFHFATMFAAGLSLSSCQYGVSVSVSGTAANLAIDLKEDGAFAETPPQFGDMTLVTKEGDHWKTLWQVSSIDRRCGPAVAHLMYGEVPKGFATDMPPEHLVDGQDYELDIGGCGRTGAAFFRFSNGQIVGSPRPQ